MGQTESTEPTSSQVTGFDPETSTTGRLRRRRDTERELPDASKSNIEEDAFLKFADVADTISPIYESNATKDKKLDTYYDTITDTNLTKLLNEFGINEHEEGSDDSNDDDKIYGFSDDKDEASESSELSDDNANRGIFHHEQKYKEDESTDLTSSSVHPIYVQGDLCVGQRIRVRDGSAWSKQYPIYEISWFIGIEVGTQVLFNTVPDDYKEQFILPSIAVGRYIQAVAKRLVEDQCADTYTAGEQKGIYDPHLGKMKALETGAEKQSVIVTSVAVVGPVLISDEWAYMVVKMLAQGKFSCSVKLNPNEALERGSHNLDGARRKSMNGSLDLQGSLQVNYSHLKLECDLVAENETKQKKGSSLFLDWVRELLGEKILTESLVVDLNDTNNKMLKFRFKHKRIVYQSGIADNVICIKRKEQKKKMRRSSEDAYHSLQMHIESSLGRDAVLYILLGFQAASYFKMKDTHSWDTVFTNGEFDKAKDLIQRYLEEMVSTMQNIIS